MMSNVNELYQKHVHYELQSLDNEPRGVLNKEKIHQKILAFLAEVGKVSEESRCFSFWDTSTMDPKDLLDYYIDGLQLLLSIGFELQVEALKPYTELPNKQTLVDQFLIVYQAILHLQKTYIFEDYQDVIDDYLTLGFLLGFDIDTIMETYKTNI